MSYRVRPWFSLSTPHSRRRSEASRIVTGLFEYRPDATNPTAPRYHSGYGAPVRCERTGDFFPSSRIRRQQDGKLVGDIVYVPNSGPVNSTYKGWL